jgi:hypothetical protein
VVATHPADQNGKKRTNQKKTVGVTRGGVVYELFFTNLPQQAFTACDVVELYLHRGAFESTLADEDQEIDSDRWSSHARVGTRSMAMHCAMGMEPQAGTGASPQAGVGAYHRGGLLHATGPKLGNHLHRATGLPLLDVLGKLGGTRGKTLRSSPMGRCSVLLIRSCSRMNTVEKLLEACA